MYETLLLLTLFVTFALLDRAKIQHKPWFFDGFFSAITLLVYGPMRVLFDSLRATDLETIGRRSDIRYFGSLALTPAQIGAILLFCLGVWMFISRSGKGQMDISQEELRDWKPHEITPEIRARAEAGPRYARPELDEEPAAVEEAPETDAT